MALNMELRRKGVTSSGVSEVLGMNPWGSPWHYWARYHGMLPDIEQTPRMKWGKIVERSILTHAATDLPGMVCELNGATKGSNIVGLDWDEEEEQTVQSKTHPLCLATPDGWWYELLEGVILKPESEAVALGEAKNVGGHMSHDWARPDEVPDGIPEYVYCQVQWGMAADDLQKAIVAASIGGSPPRIYEIDFDPEFFQLAYGVIEEFWNDHILTAEPPRVDPDDSRAQKWLKEFYRDQRSEELLQLEGPLETRAARAARQVQEAKEAIKAWNKYKARAEAVLRDTIRDTAGVRGAGWQATNKQDASGGTDWKGIAQKLLPLCKDPNALLEQHAKPGSRKLNVKLEVTDE